MISAESKELLQDFEKRMRFVNLIKYWLQRSKPTEIRELLHNDDDKTDNLILMIMVFIMDSTLRYGERCTKQDIAAFLRELADVYGYESESAKILTDYIVTDVLQGGGKVRRFDTFDSHEEEFCEQGSLILIEQQSGSYVLTNEAYEFLFRTKEIDSELDFSVNRFKLQEFIKRGNYGKALRESRELVSRVRNLKTRMDDFMLRCRTNISEVSIDEYEEIVTQVKDSFEDENKQLGDIRTLISAKWQAIADAEIKKDENIGQTEQEIREILENIDIVADITHYCIKGLEVPYIYGRLGRGLTLDSSRPLVAKFVYGALCRSSDVNKKSLDDFDKLEGMDGFENKETNNF